MTTQDTLREIESTLATLAYQIERIDADLCIGTDAARLESAAELLNEAEDLLASIDTPIFPYQAWDLIGKQVVTVVGWHNRTMLRLDDGDFVRPSDVTTAFPAWLADAQQREADARDERETMASALDVAVQ